MCVRAFAGKKKTGEMVSIFSCPESRKNVEMNLPKENPEPIQELELPLNPSLKIPI